MIYVASASTDTVFITFKSKLLFSTRMCTFVIITVGRGGDADNHLDEAPQHDTVIYFVEEKKKRTIKTA